MFNELFVMMMMSGEYIVPVRFFAFLIIFISRASAYATISEDTLRAIPAPGNDFDINDGALLAPILIPRVPGTSGSTKVLNHFVDFFKSSLPDWKLEIQNSTSTTPTSNGKQVPFKNLIATRDPPGSKVGEVGRLALVAHYDSLQKPEGFVGAIDSAAPCAMLLHAARSIDKALTKKWDAAAKEGLDSLDVATEKGVQILLLDGEEAFLHWSDTDSIYGARALAEAWENMPHPGPSTYHNNISSIDLFVLLDLIGAKDTQIPSYYLPTHWAYKAMAKLEQRLRTLGEFKTTMTQAGKDADTAAEGKLFLPSSDLQPSHFGFTGMGDDHLPFLARGVEVLHLIPQHFPAVWHTLEDDGAHLDTATVEDWAKLITAFAAEWLELEGYQLGDGVKNHERRATGDHAEL